jgi:hypothetical protein
MGKTYLITVITVSKSFLEGLEKPESQPQTPTYGTKSPSGSLPPHYRGLTMTPRHTTLVKTPFDD